MSTINKDVVMQKIEKYFKENSTEKIEQDLIDSGYYEYTDNQSNFFIENCFDYLQYNMKEYAVDTNVISSQFLKTSTELNIRYAIHNLLNLDIEGQGHLLDKENEYDYALAA